MTLLNTVSQQDDSTLLPLIVDVQAATGSHTVVYLSSAGIHWKDGTEESCTVMARIINDGGRISLLHGLISEAKVLPREEFLAGLMQIQEGA